VTRSTSSTPGFPYTPQTCPEAVPMTNNSDSSAYEVCRNCAGDLCPTCRATHVAHRFDTCCDEP
jgi:hypothetical protein